MKVTGMVLFDAVDRSLAINSAEIPRNVLRVVYARREPLAGSRGTFGNCGNIWHAPTKTSMRNFWGTHGALGGVPWPTPPGGKSTDYIDEGLIEFQSRVTYAQDARCSREVWTWVSPKLAELGMLGGKPSVQAAV